MQRLLVEAAGWGDPREVGRLLRVGADPDLPDRDGTTPLYRASVQGRADTVRLLLAAGAGANRESGAGDEGLPLCAAVCQEHEDVAELLLRAGADPDLVETGGLSAAGYRRRNSLPSGSASTPGPR